MMKNKWIRRVAYTLIILLIFLGGCIFFSPYQRYKTELHRSITVSVTVHCSADSIFRYLGNSSNAAHWSSYVDHISPLNEAQFADGTVGSERRCFKNAGEDGMTWDERVEEAEENRKRILSIYNLRESSISTNSTMLTEQRYTSLGTGKTRLTFTLYFDEQPPTWTDFLKMSLAGYTIESIFEKNLSAIKRICETGK